MARRKAPILPLIVTVVALVICALIVAGGVYLQKAGERQAYAAAVAGPACQAVAAPPNFVRSTELKRLTFQRVSFGYLRGDADCQTVRPGRFGEDRERPYCVFDRPGYVEARSGGARADYVVPVGQASVMAEPGGLRCAVQPSP